MATRQTAGTRAKDSDRNDTCRILDNALSEGQLSMTEHGERVKAATNAATLGELQDLVSDLQNSNAPVQLPSLKKRPRLPGACPVQVVVWPGLIRISARGSAPPSKRIHAEPSRRRPRISTGPS